MIHGNVPGLTHHVFFISAGKCEIVKRVGFVRCVSPFLRPELILQGSKSEKADPKKFLNKPYGRRLRRLTPEDHYLTVLTLTAGEYFGVGKYIYLGIGEHPKQTCSLKTKNIQNDNFTSINKFVLPKTKRLNCLIILFEFCNFCNLS